MKYIVTERDHKDGKIEEIFIFSEEVHHDCMAQVLNGIRNQSWGDWERLLRKPISAGFVRGGKCEGYSETLKLKARPEIDTTMLVGEGARFVAPEKEVPRDNPLLGESQDPRYQAYKKSLAENLVEYEDDQPEEGLVPEDEDSDPNE